MVTDYNPPIYTKLDLCIHTIAGEIELGDFKHLYIIFRNCDKELILSELKKVFKIHNIYIDNITEKVIWVKYNNKNVTLNFIPLLNKTRDLKFITNPVVDITDIGS